jgi:hypothetical protein
MFCLDDELSTFLTQGNSVVVATRNAAFEPYATRASGLRIGAEGRVEVLLPRATSVRTIADLRQNGEMATCVSSPADFRTHQLKGRCLGITESSAEDVLLCEQQMRAFAGTVVRFGYTRAQVRNLWLFDLWRVEMQVLAVFAQTPGPAAGAQMAMAHVD